MYINNLFLLFFFLDGIASKFSFRANKMREREKESGKRREGRDAEI
jgi:hypothetical protein